VSGLVLAALVFLALHALPSTPLRPRAVAWVGEAAWRGGYSVASLAALVWLVAAYRAAPAETLLWDAGTAGRHLAALLLLPAAILATNAFTGANPTAVGGEGRGDPAGRASGAMRVTRNPLMWGIGLWGLAHMLANGDAPSLVFFGSLAVLALGGTVLIDRRKAAAGGAAWERFAAVTSNLPFRAIAEGRNRLVAGELWWRVLAGLAVYAVLVAAHPAVIGADPFP